MENQNYSAVRVITAGSVDDGKSTLIGRLLYDTKNVHRDQISAISKSKYNRTADAAMLDLSLLTDGLEAEREQGITIDVAYRYFSTQKKKFILGDCPGHEMYTRNMITAASTADVGIVLIDVAKVKYDSSGRAILLTQTRRHSNIFKLMSTRHVIVAINKMDLANYSEDVFNKIKISFLEMVKSIELQSSLHFLPISALKGDNVVHLSQAMPWYDGPSLLSVLEEMNLSRLPNFTNLRFPIQLVSRSQGDTVDSFRGYMGQVASGDLKIGDEIKVHPSGQLACIKSILRAGTPVVRASTGDSITITLDRELDISRGDMFYGAKETIINATSIKANICWFSESTMNKNQKLLIKIGTQTIKAHVNQIAYKFDVNTNEQILTDSLALNDIADVDFTLHKPVIVDSYLSHPNTGSFIMIDEVTNETLAAGMIQV